MQSVKARIDKFNAPFLSTMIKIKYKLMYKDIYNFYRATCHLFYEDLHKSKKIPTSPIVWGCGDLHMENFGSFRGDNRLVYFDLNDFDEASLMPSSWELARFLTSLFIAFESMQIEEIKAMNMAKLFLKSYCATLTNGKSKYLEPKTSKGIVCEFLSEARDRKFKKLLEKRTEKINGKRYIRITQKHMPVDTGLRKQLCTTIKKWIANHPDSPYNYEVQDVVFRVAGLGSLGLKRYLFLLKSTNIEEKYLLVDMKESKPSALELYSPIKQPAWNNHTARTIEIQRRMQNVAPALLSGITFKGECYVIQEMQSAKDGIRLSVIKDQYRDMYQVIDDMALLTASAQLRSSGREGSASADELILFGQHDNWQEKLLQYAFDYKNTIQVYYSEFVKSYSDTKKNPKLVV